MNGEFEIIEYSCVDNPSDYDNTLLYNSGEHIAYILVKTNTDKGDEFEIEIDLTVRGEVQIKLFDSIDEEWYYSPDEYPDDLKAALIAKEFDKIDIAHNNWLEGIFDIRKNGVSICSDGECWDSIDGETITSLKNQLMEEAKSLYKYYVSERGLD